MSNILDAVLEVFTSIGEWITTTVPTFYGLFYNAESGLTLLGVLAVCGLGMSVVFLLISVIQGFLHWRS